jgi:hypothetical protein
MPESTFDDLMRQQEKGMIYDPLGLFTVLKNIQNRKCSCGFLCIEIGTIYGDWDLLRPKNITIPFHHKKNVHMIIKPILVINNTKIPDNPPNITPPINITDLFEEEDCDVLKISGNYNPTDYHPNNNTQNYNMRFKQIVVKRQNIQRKFYRKVAIADEIYSQDTFKQGLNLIIVQRDKKYSLFKDNYHYWYR